MIDFLLVPLGAIFAFILAFFLYAYQKKAQEGQYLSFTISYIISQTSQLYCLKKDHLISRVSEVTELQKRIINREEALEIKEIANVLSNPQHSSSNINLEKLSFLADFDPNLLVLTKAALDADSGVNEIINNCNLQIREVKKSEELAEIWLLTCFNKCLYDQVDYALALMAHTQKQLIEYSKNEFQYYTIIKNFTIDKKYKKLTPKSENSLLRIVYAQKNWSIVQKVTRIFNRFKTVL
jgi:hypothetical protein